MQTLLFGEDSEPPVRNTGLTLRENSSGEKSPTMSLPEEDIFDVAQAAAEAAQREEEQERIRLFLNAQRVSFPDIHDEDDKKKGVLARKLGAVLSRGLPCKQHCVGCPHAFSCFLKLAPPGGVQGRRGNSKRLTWEGGRPLESSGFRELDLVNVELVSSGTAGGSFASCPSTAFAAEPRCCVSLILYKSWFGNVESLDLEFSR